MTDESGASQGGMRIEADLVRQLAELLDQNHLTEIEVEDGDRRISVRRQVTAAPAPVYAAPAPAAAPAAAAPAAPAAAPVPDVPAGAHPGTVKSPMVGTVYLAGEPGAKPFVSPGQSVKEGETLLIIEAMKVMNPVPAPRSGTVTQVLVQDGQPVEFDQPLFVIE